MLKKEKRGMFYKEYGWRGLTIFFGLFVIVLTIVIGAFLIYKGSDTFLKFGHTIWEFLRLEKNFIVRLSKFLPEFHPWYTGG